MEYYIGIDIGGTNMVCGLLGPDEEVIRLMQQETRVDLGFGSVVERIVLAVQDLLQAEGLKMDQLRAVGIGTPGLVNPQTGVVMSASNMKWKDVPLARFVQEKLNKPVYVDNDVRMYVFGEAAAGAAKDHQHVLGITLGTGLAAAMINDKTLYYGRDFIAGELGHIKLPEIDYPCSCGMTGCLETVASATGMVRQATERLEQGRSSLLTSAYHAGKLTSADISQAFDKGDELAIEVMNRTGRLLGIGLSYAVTFLSPDVIVVGGGASKAGERLLKPLRATLQQWLMPRHWEALTIKLATRTDDAGVIGSALSAKQKISQN